MLLFLKDCWPVLQLIWTQTIEIQRAPCWFGRHWWHILTWNCWKQYNLRNPKHTVFKRSSMLLRWSLRTILKSSSALLPAPWRLSAFPLRELKNWIILFWRCRFGICNSPVAWIFHRTNHLSAEVQVDYHSDCCQRIFGFDVMLLLKYYSSLNFNLIQCTELYLRMNIRNWSWVGSIFINLTQNYCESSLACQRSHVQFCKQKSKMTDGTFGEQDVPSTELADIIDNAVGSFCSFRILRLINKKKLTFKWKSLNFMLRIWKIVITQFE